MFVRKLLLSSILATGLIGTAQAAEFEIDPDHSEILFEVSHWGFGYVVGRFNDFEGTIEWDQNNPESASVTVDIDPASIDSGNDKLDAHLRNPDFFETDKFPEAGFKSTGYEGTADEGTLSGILTMHGQEHPVTLAVTRSGEGEAGGGAHKVGFKAHGHIDRGDWGMDWRRGKGADDITVTIWIEAVHRVSE